ncbi:Tim44 domain-containing protein [Paludibacterium purpuratum]|uniref:Putative lipid-binding transport protein (Tim44 family) n=1 Tax=Paludibacterium purpuratum TaxID=1144873 RepID=A0A4R7B9Y7_9NEIS|nr:TIM44-like domain-containing protein [Paludibacterium purpuratum]TDR80655.1 putative lipid-binding transport protein (Tim44 family) [Paludibacterium purpuratum]
MNSRAKTAILAFSLISLLLSPLAEAARMGKGRSVGMRRAAPTQSYQRQTTPVAPQPAPAQVPAQPQKKGVGVGTAIAAGAAGAAVGYMAGSAMSNKANAAPATASAPAAAAAEQAPQQPGIPWHWVILLGAVFLIGLVWFRRRMAMPEHAPQAHRPAPPSAQPLANDNRFDPIPAIGSGFPNNGGNAAPTAAFDTRRLPDGTETPYFLRQAKGIFLHLQSLNSPDSLDEVRRYMTPELFEELRHDIAGNQAVADFTNLDCQLVECSEENGRIVASVRFLGQVSEEVNAAPVPFSETWHFIKSADTNGKWMVSGIQQS